MSQTQYLINGRNDSGLSPLDRGFAYGDGVFRTLRVSQGAPHAWALHYNKLVEDCNRLGIVCPTAEQLLGDIERLCGNEKAVVVKMIITRGESVRGYAPPVVAQPTRIVIKSAMPDYPQDNFDQGITLHLCSLRLAHQPKLAGIKHLNRLENVLARSEWTDSQIADGLLLDQHENAIECTMSNVFVRFGTSLATPALDKCGVAGITRQRILDAAIDLGYVPIVRSISLPELLEADEVIICNSLYGAWQVRRLGSQLWQRQGLAMNLQNILK